MFCSAKGGQGGRGLLATPVAPIIVGISGNVSYVPPALWRCSLSPGPNRNPYSFPDTGGCTVDNSNQIPKYRGQRKSTGDVACIELVGRRFYLGRMVPRTAGRSMPDAWPNGRQTAGAWQSQPMTWSGDHRQADGAQPEGNGRVYESKPRSGAGRAMISQPAGVITALFSVARRVRDGRAGRPRLS